VSLLARVLGRLYQDLSALGAEWAVIGGLALNARSRPRTTFDIDLAVAVGSDAQAEALILGLRSKGYREQFHLEQEAMGRLATVRLEPPQEVGVVPIDLLFASSGIEPEIVRAAEMLEVLPGLTLPIARAGHLLALKILAGRPQDLVDARTLLAVASAEELNLAHDALEQIQGRGFHRGRVSLGQELSALRAQAQ